MTHKVVIATILLVQVVCAFFFVSEILASVLGIPYQPLDWAFVELIEIGAALGLILGVVLGGFALRESFRRTRRAEEALRRASTAFMEVLEERFTDWGLTPAERDVALFAIKGMSTQEIATLRSTSEGTVKAQTNAIYRKAGVTGRPQLLSLFIDDLMEQGPRKPETRMSA
jgi:DNA-binding CsgD family transcriptional regulator